MIRSPIPFTVLWNQSSVLTFLNKEVNSFEILGWGMIEH